MGICYGGLDTVGFGKTCSPDSGIQKRASASRARAARAPCNLAKENM